MKEKISEILISKFNERINIEKDVIDCVTVYLKSKDDLMSFMSYLKENEELSFDLITDITALDYPNRAERFVLVYHIFSIKNKERIRIKLPIKDGESVKSVTSIWRGAEWLEREVYDMFGISFEGHPDLRRILMTEDYKYHPLRKDFPLTGIEES